MRESPSFIAYTVKTDNWLDASIAVAVVNPRRVRDFAKGIGIDAKTDPIDAKVVARYGEVVALKPAIPKTTAQRRKVGDNDEKLGTTTKLLL